MLGPMNRRRPGADWWRAAQGLSVVELLVGIAIGLVVLAGATAIAAGQLSGHRALLLEAQIEQDLRAAAGLILRDLRRAGHWGHASRRVWASPDAVTDNAYDVVTVRPGTGGRAAELVYSVSSFSQSGVEDDAVSPGEVYGVAHNAVAGTLEMKLGSAPWQALTDPQAVRITQFDLEVRPRVLAVPCAIACPDGGTSCWPQQTVREVSIAITGQAIHDAGVRRSVRGAARLRNDATRGVCP